VQWEECSARQPRARKHSRLRAWAVGVRAYPTPAKCTLALVRPLFPGERAQCVSAVRLNLASIVLVAEKTESIWDLISKSPTIRPPAGWEVHSLGFAFMVCDAPHFNFRGVCAIGTLSTEIAV